ncbi:MAG: DUF1622 domain-containing protein [Clostridia bacterium]|nr:DUF1622 domain-containing protein [Clostridia bacterium]
MLESTEHFFHLAVHVTSLCLEIVGVIIIAVTAVRCLWRMLAHRENIRIPMAEGISLALLFKLAGEVLHTVLADSLQDIALLASVMAVRAAITILLHWEISQEKKHLPGHDQ